jgi:putative PIN family toxin of toxin-antitoxin system
VLSATLDSSVYIRALQLGGAAAHLLGYAREGQLRIDVSDPILDETMRVLRDKFKWSGEMLHFTRQNLSRITNRVEPAHRLDIIKEDEPDNRILECAATANSDYIVSEDNDLLRLGQQAGTPIVPVRDFIRVAVTAARQR